jgi:predicted methyltransferase
MNQTARVLRRGGRLFHYTGSPNRLTSRRDVPREAAEEGQEGAARAGSVLTIRG